MEAMNTFSQLIVYLERKNSLNHFCCRKEKNNGKIKTTLLLLPISSEMDMQLKKGGKKRIHGGKAKKSSKYPANAVSTYAR